MTKDLTQGKPLKIIIMFSLPILLGNIFQQLYNMVDTIIVGRTISADALAGVGLTGSVSFLILGFVMGITSGFSIITSQFFGAGDNENMKRSIGTSIILCFFFTVGLTVLSVLFAKPLLLLINTPESLFGYAYDYIIIIFSGVCASVFYNMVASILRAVGDSKTPLIFLIVASLINIGLDLLFILLFKMGVAGAGLATVISQIISGIACLILMKYKFPMLKLSKRHFKLEKAFVLKHLKVALPMAFQFSITAIGAIILQASLNTLGEVVVTGYTVASKVDQLVTQPLVAIGLAMAVFVAQNYGAGEIDRIKQGVKGSVLISAIFSVFAIAFVLIFGELMARLFLGSGQSMTPIINEVRTYYYIIIGFYFILGLLYLFRNALQGMGRGGLTFVSGAIELTMRVLVAILFTQAFGFVGACLANPLAWVGAAIFLVIAYIVVFKKVKKQKELGLLNVIKKNPLIEAETKISKNAEENDVKSDKNNAIK